MQPFTQHTGFVVPLERENVDTDQIIPKQFLKRIERTGYGDFLFYDWRYHEGKPNRDFILNAEQYGGATILAAGRNFGCGSSREHAVWALRDYGFRVIVAPSFADIFTTNSAKNGLLLVTLDSAEIAAIMSRAAAGAFNLSVDLESCTISSADGFATKFTVDPFTRTSLLLGMDEIGMTLQHEAEIAIYEKSHRCLPD
ncbi:MAG TPA: 3-isopropylmalate dehydratase small subunit [Candidatus Angelobacter sp.]|nr:3-isopropylmalate dehydratase small subunit [Candidatus Angelobacter sp.]